jgi:hypothetical protein
MGWNSWNTFADRIDEIQIRQIADVMVSSSIRDAGFSYPLTACPRPESQGCWRTQQNKPRGLHRRGFRFSWPWRAGRMLTWRTWRRPAWLWDRSWEG